MSTSSDGKTSFDDLIILSSDKVPKESKNWPVEWCRGKRQKCGDKGIVACYRMEAASAVFEFKPKISQERVSELLKQIAKEKSNDTANTDFYQLKYSCNKSECNVRNTIYVSTVDLKQAFFGKNPVHENEKCRPVAECSNKSMKVQH